MTSHSSNVYYCCIGILLWLCSFAVLVQCQLEGSGSGDDTTDVPPNLIVPAHGSKDDGSGSEVYIVPTPKRLNTDDEDSIEIIYSGDDEEIGKVEGSGHIPKLMAPKLDKNRRCSDTNLYCWCINSDGNEIPNTRRYIDDDADVDCTFEHGISVTSVQPTKTTKMASIPFRMIDTTTARRKSSPKYYTTARLSEHKHTQPASTKHAAGTANERIAQQNNVKRERVFPLFTHPGILAAIIGGGVVALLCALLLVMFVVYRMRKKDEGSYPLDPNAKPQRLHTYTRAPNKEFYA